MSARQASKAFFFNGKKLEAMQSVYDPREDSFLLARTVHSLQGKTVLDLGCGTGIQGINAFFNGAKKVVFADANKTALLNAQKNAKTCGFSNIETIETDLFENINKKFDCIIFNPPYVESEKIKFIDVDGGKKGRETIDRFIKGAKKRLAKNGELFLLQSSLNNGKKTRKMLKENGFKSEILGRKKLFFEELVVFRAWL